MEYFYGGGLFLTTEEQLLMQLSLPQLQNENKLESVAFLGKIFGKNSDYYIAQGRGNDFIRNKHSFYSLDGETWNLLFSASKEDLRKFHMVRTRFQGDPTYVHRFRERTQEGKKSTIKEENRLSAMVKLMDFETAIGPKNVLIINAQGIVKRNTYFKGLSKDDSLNLNSYLHYRLPDSDVSFAPTALLCPVGGDVAMDFLEPISMDYPPGCWVMHNDSLEEVVTLRNLWWPGFMFYYRPETSDYNSIYMGYGDRNDDLPFML
ncbi:radial spoke head protein 9 homolog [Uloborus diversus]|uniref:radial spoke head protein 9 homolog n=1 Tax=Uloborus diversus TaxID=327109 RepID=UPI002409A719|nr:radial spoke head protein 9 homolog [Uloborus diversus]